MTERSAHRVKDADTASEHKADQHGTNYERRIYGRRTWKQPEARGRNTMRAGRTELRGSSRDGDAIERTSGSIAGLRGTAPGRAGWRATVMTVIAGILLAGPASKAAADDLVGNLGAFSITAGEEERLANNDFAQPFTTGANVSGYQLTSISIDFATGGRRTHDPIYVYLQEDNGNGRPNHNNGGQVATLERNGSNYLGPVAGVNKYKVCSPFKVLIDTHTRT